jgi:hypothetical protein
MSPSRFSHDALVARGAPDLWARGLRVLLLLAFFAQLLFSSLGKSPTIDEPNHLARGYAYLKTGDLRLSRDEGHPPLFNLLCALPLALVEDLKLPTDRPSWQSGFRNAFAVEFLFGGDSPLAQVVFLGRLPVMLAMMCVAALVARWAGDLYGPRGSVLALALCAFDPNLIAHGRLVTTDAGITLFVLATLYLFWRFLQRPSWYMLVATGVALGAALGVKFSALLLLPLLGLLGLIEALNPRGSLSFSRRLLRTHSSRRRVGARGRPRWLSSLAVCASVMVAVVALAGLTLWAIYGFQVGRPAGWGIDVPAPVYVEGLEKTLAHAAEVGHPSFLMGQRSTQGWWYYFPAAFALKTPIPSLIALLRALLSMIRARLGRWEWVLLLAPAVYFAASVGSVLNIGYRHLLPTLPFLWIYVGRLASNLRPHSDARTHSDAQTHSDAPGESIIRALAGRGGMWGRVSAALSMAALGVWLATGTLSVAPDYLAYFNAFAGGPDGGWRYLVDSNLDWGQDLPSLAAYLEGHKSERVYLSWFGCTYPHLYGLDLSYHLLPSHLSYPYPGDAAQSPYNPLYPAPGLYAIGATNLNGVGLAAGDVFANFRGLEPIARVGHSIHIYEIAEVPGELADAASDGVLRPTCISRLRFKDLSEKAEAASLGRGPGAVKWFDHQRGFILPAVGDPAYVLPSPPLAFAPGWQDAFLAQAEVVHTQAEGEPAPSGRGLPGALVYHLDRASADAVREEMLGAIPAAPISWSPSAVFDLQAEVYALPGPASFEHGLELVGYRLLSGETLQPGETLELLTMWRPEAEMPASASDLRIFVHLLDTHSRVWGGEDRLDLHPPTWEGGDLLVQYHRVPLAVDAGPGIYQLEIGLYATITMKRLALHVGGVPVADRLLLQPIQVPER